MIRLHRILLALTVAAVAADSASAQRLGSIYDPFAGPLRPAANKTAYRVGDLVTVIIKETQDVKNEEKTDLNKASGLDYELARFDVKPDMLNLPFGVESDRSDTFTGNAKYEKRGNFTARLTAIVMDTLPSGNLVIQGRRELRIDDEVKVIEFSGIVRRYDVTAANTIESELVADAHISYSGSGPMTRATNRHGLGGWLYEVLDWVWPF